MISKIIDVLVRHLDVLLWVIIAIASLKEENISSIQIPENHGVLVKKL
jgi:hypothetical protein